MKEKDWLVDNNGVCLPLKTVFMPSKTASMYRLYRFLTDLEDILETTPDDLKRLGAIVPLMRKLLNESPWLYLSMLEPNPDTGCRKSTNYQF